MYIFLGLTWSSINQGWWLNHVEIHENAAMIIECKSFECAGGGCFAWKSIYSHTHTKAFLADCSSKLRNNLLTENN